MKWTEWGRVGENKLRAGEYIAVSISRKTSAMCYSRSANRGLCKGERNSAWENCGNISWSRWGLSWTLGRVELPPVDTCSVLGCLGCITKHHKLGGLNNRHLFFTVLESRKFTITVSAGSFPDESSLPGLLTVFLLCPHMAEREQKQALWSLLIRALIPS